MPFPFYPAGYGKMRSLRRLKSIEPKERVRERESAWGRKGIWTTMQNNTIPKVISPGCEDTLASS